MKTLIVALVIGFLSSVSVAREAEENRRSKTPDNPIAVQLSNEIVAAEESGNEDLLAMLVQRFKQQFPGLPLTLQTAKDKPAANEITGSRSMLDTVLHVVPPAYSGTPGTATFLGPLANAQRTYQLLIHDSMLVGLVGRRLTGFSWRLPTSATATWPAADVTFTNYDVYLSGSVTPANRSFTFAQNVVGQQTQVRSGSLAISMESYLFGGSPNAWGPETNLTPWLYAGGHLLIEIRHSGFTGTSRSLDAIGTAIPGYGTMFSAAWTGNYAGTTGAQGNFCVLRLMADSLTVSVGDDDRDIPATFSLGQNYPNPFNPATTISFSLPVAGHIQLNVFDVLGNEVATLVNGEMRTGDHTATFDASRLASGTYFYRLQSGGFVQTKRLMVLK